MKIKTSITERVLSKNNQFKILQTELYNEVVVRAYEPVTGESVTMSFPRLISKYPMSHPEVKAAIQKCLDTTTKSLLDYLEGNTERKLRLAKKAQ